jgi:hypothetical protein
MFNNFFLLIYSAHDVIKFVDVLAVHWLNYFLRILYKFLEKLLSTWFFVKYWLLLHMDALWE